MTSTRTILLAVTLLALTSCARRAEFRPVHAPESVPPQLAGVEYEINVNGANLGDVKVWSEGATTRKVNGKQRVVHVGLRIRNDDSAPLRFDPARASIAVISDDGQLLEIKRPVSVRGDTTIQPGEIGRIQLQYPVPNHVDVYEIAGFEFNWAVESETAVATNSTTFVREGQDEDRVRYGVGMGFYDPYWGTPYHYRPYWP